MTSASRPIATGRRPGRRPGLAGLVAVRPQLATGVAVVLIGAAAVARLLDAGRLPWAVVWLFVLPASAVQSVSAVLLVPRRPAGSRPIRVGLALNVGVGVAWLVLRSVSDPSQPRGGPVAALSGQAQLLSVAALAATALVLPRAGWTVPRTHSGRRRLVAALCGGWVLALALGTSLFAVYVPNITMIGTSPVLAVRLTPEAWPGGPRVDAVVGGHLLVVVNASTAAFAVLSTALVVVLVDSRLEAATRQVACRSGRSSRGALAAGLMSAPGCCAVPLTAVLGPAALAAVAAATPYLMLAVVLVLAGDVVRTRRLLARRPAPSQEPAVAVVW